ncbi:PREDICTED: uncharacterized protein LOC107343911 [Acropora digitifera]|uniref:uncharacterized protein LOC107343911 n=1 Tax=Acropora digitifera TaxID=70779 RepID=UPI00077A1B14|nr:PREDICTED: uncharacterized protein LOC107343911 [Acropora digitifera]
MRLRLASCFNYQLMSVLLAGIILFLAGTYHWSQDQNSQNEGIVTTVQSRLKSNDKTYLPEAMCIPGGLPSTRGELFKLYDGVETFLMFIGYPRSSHSLVGALLDAHPQIIISNEYHIVNKWDIYRDDALKSFGMQKYLLFYNLQSISTWQATFGVRSKEPAFLDDGINSYNVPGAWQGSFDGKIKVIGDSSGLVTSTKLLTNKGNFSVLREVEAVVKIPLKFIHVITNPFDDIASIVTKQSQQGKKVNDSNAVNQAMNHIFALLDTNDKLRQIYGERVLDVFIYDSVPKQRKTLRKICTFLEIYCDDSFSSGIETLFGDDITSRPRDQVEWREKTKT